MWIFAASDELIVLATTLLLEFLQCLGVGISAKQSFLEKLVRSDDEEGE